MEQEKALAEKKAAAKSESIEVVDFKEQLIGYIRDELHQGFSLNQIKDALVDQGYEEEEIAFAIVYVKTRFKVSEKDTTKDRKKRTDKHHYQIRFIAPVVGILLLTFALMAAFFTFDGAEQMHEKEITDLLPYFKMGLDPETSNIISEDRLAMRTELVDVARAKAMIRSKKSDPLFNNILVADDIIDSFHKTATYYKVERQGSIIDRTLIEIRAKTKKEANNLKIIEVIPKFILDSTDDINLESGLVIEKDPILQWSYSTVKADQLIVIRYTIDAALEKYDTLTLPAVQKAIVARGPTLCGNGLCEIGESYMGCCDDCGCLPGFDCRKNVCSAKPKDECQIDSQCDDGDISTSDICSGIPKRCSNDPITECIHGDGFCPKSCVFDTDVDCPPPEVFAPREGGSKVPVTGKGLILNKSLPPWDPAFVCEEDWWCTDGDSCTEDLCNLETKRCQWNDITECIDDDGCCPVSCSEVNDDDCRV